MVAEPRMISIEPDSELARILDEAVAGNAVLVRGGERFRVIRDGTAGLPAYDHERAWDALQRSFGILRGIDRERVKAEIRAQREQDSHGRPGT